MIPPGVKVAVLIGLLVTAFFAGRSYESNIAERAAAKTEATRTRQDADRDISGARFAAFMSQAGTEAVTNYVLRNEEDAPAVERAADRIRAVCLRDEREDHLRRSMPKGSGLLEATGRQARNDRDRAYVAAIERDITTCQRELVRLDESARYLRIQDGEETP